jgi:hypothetical protein
MYALAREPARRTVYERPLLGMSRKTRGVAAAWPTAEPAPAERLRHASLRTAATQNPSEEFQ